MGILSSIMAVTSTSSSVAGSSGEASILTSVTTNLFVIAAGICVIVGTWKILEKAGEDGWKAIIPFYGEYTLFKTFWDKKWFWLSLIPKLLSFVSAIVIFAMLVYFSVAGVTTVFAGGLLPFIGAAVVDDPSVSDTVISEYSSSVSKVASGIGGAEVGLYVSFMVLVLCLIFELVLRIILDNKISKAFGKDVGFTVGLVLLAPVFYLILGCGKAEYQKPSGDKPGETLLTGNSIGNNVNNGPQDSNNPGGTR